MQIKHQIIKFWDAYKDKIVFALAIIQIVIGYKLTQMYFPVGHILKIAVIDDSIPFISIFVLAYLCDIIVISIPFIFTFRNKKQLLAVSTAFFFVATIGLLCYMFFQTTIIRPIIIPHNIFDRLVLFVYSIDAPVNLFPSLHVALPLLATLCLSQIRKKSVYILAPITILIILSTVFIKQHHIIDIVGGIVVALIGYELVFKKIMDEKGNTTLVRITE